MPTLLLSTSPTSRRLEHAKKAWPGSKLQAKPKSASFNLGFDLETAPEEAFQWCSGPRGIGNALRCMFKDVLRVQHIALHRRLTGVCRPNRSKTPREGRGSFEVLGLGGLELMLRRGDAAPKGLLFWLFKTPSVWHRRPCSHGDSSPHSGSVPSGDPPANTKLPKSL